MKFCEPVYNHDGAIVGLDVDGDPRAFITAEIVEVGDQDNELPMIEIYIPDQAFGVVGLVQLIEWLEVTVRSLHCARETMGFDQSYIDEYLTDARADG